MVNWRANGVSRELYKLNNEHEVINNKIFMINKYKLIGIVKAVRNNLRRDRDLIEKKILSLENKETIIRKKDRNG